MIDCFAGSHQNYPMDFKHRGFLMKRVKRAARMAAGCIAVVMAFTLAAYAVVWTVGKLNGYECGFTSCVRPKL